MKRITLLLLALATGFTITSGCSISGDDDPNSVKIWITPWDTLAKEEFDRYITEAVAKKYPDIQIKKLEKPITEKTLNEWKPKGIVPDLIVTRSTYLSDLKPLGLLNDVQPVLDEAGFDPNRLDPNALESVKNASGGEFLAGIPFTRQFNALYYNKDIFDKFKVPYPKDGLTWQEVAEVASKVTKKEGETQYRGMEPDLIGVPASELRAAYFDRQTGQPLVNNTTWRTVFSAIKPIYDIPGNEEKTEVGGAFHQFFEEKRLAMVGGENWLRELEGMKDLPNWDMASYPTFREAPSVGPQFDSHVMVVTEKSKHKKEAGQIIETLLSNEVQTDMSKNGRVSVLSSGAIRDVFGSEGPLLNGKNIQALFKTTPAKPIVPMENDHEAGIVMDTAMRQAVMAKQDVDQVLGEALDSMNLFMYLKR
ncbi:MAG: family 1 extracellular solute-binding protein [Paenibacillaceae bacterium]|nr:family 1 extracellular solute-binding protein [Paenibacillaceae bacterium]